MIMIHYTFAFRLSMSVQCTQALLLGILFNTKVLPCFSVSLIECLYKLVIRVTAVLNSDSI